MTLISLIIKNKEVATVLLAITTKSEIFIYLNKNDSLLDLKIK